MMWLSGWASRGLARLRYDDYHRYLNYLGWSEKLVPERYVFLWSN